MKEELHFRPYAETDDRDLSRLMREVFGESWDARVFEWKYRRNPAGEPLSVVAEKNGTIIGQLGAIPVRFFMNGNEYIGSQEVDGCLDKQHGKFDTLFHVIRLRRKVNRERDIAFSYFFSVEISSRIAQKLGHTKVCSSPLLVKVLDVEPFVRKRLPARGISRLVSAPVNAALRILPPARRSIPGGTRMTRVKRFDQRFDSFWSRVRGDYPIMTVRDSAYLNWRYADAPSRDYTALCLERNETGEILGYIVLGQKQRDVLVGQILDIVTPRTGHEKVTRALLEHALEHFYERKVALVASWMLPHCHVLPELSRLWFFTREKEGVDLIVQVDKSRRSVLAPEFAGNPENWYVCMGDSDFY